MKFQRGDRVAIPQSVQYTERTPPPGGERLSRPYLEADVWSSRLYSQVPVDPDASVERAYELLSWLGSPIHPVDPFDVAQTLGWSVRLAELAAERDGQDALLIPTREGITAVIDPRLGYRERWMTTGLPAASAENILLGTLRFRLAHELGHSLFYVGTDPPRRLCGQTAAEERFCDRFARELVTASTDRSRSNDLPVLAAMLEAHTVGLTPEVAALAATDVNPHIVVLGGEVIADTTWRVCFASSLGDVLVGQEIQNFTRGDIDIYWPSDAPPIHDYRVEEDGSRFLAYVRLAYQAAAVA